MGNSCNLNKNTQQFSENTIYTESQNNKNCFTCIGDNQLNAFYADGPEINATHYAIPKGRISSYSIAYLKPDEITFFKLCSGKNLAAIRYFLKRGISVNILDEERTSPLHVACKDGGFQVVEELINWGANTNIADMAGWTPLHVATYYQRPFICHLLLKKGADPYSLNRIGETPWDLVKEKDVEDIFKVHFDRLELRKMTKKKHSIKTKLESQVTFTDDFSDLKKSQAKVLNSVRADEILHNILDDRDQIDIIKKKNDLTESALEMPNKLYKDCKNIELEQVNSLSYNIDTAFTSINYAKNLLTRDQETNLITSSGPNEDLAEEIYSIHKGKRSSLSKKSSSTGYTTKRDQTINSNRLGLVKSNETPSIFEKKKSDVFFKDLINKENFQYLLSPKKHKYYLYYKKLRKIKNNKEFQEMLCTLNSEDEDENSEYYKNVENEGILPEYPNNDFQNQNDHLISKASNNKGKLEENNTFIFENAESTSRIDELKSEDERRDLRIQPSLNSKYKKSMKYIAHSDDFTTNTRRINSHHWPKYASGLVYLQALSVNNNTSSAINLAQKDRDKIVNSPQSMSARSIIFVNHKPISIYKIIQKCDDLNMVQPEQVGFEANELQSSSPNDCNLYDEQLRPHARYAKDLYRLGIDLFNFDSLKGLSFLILFKFVKANPYDIAHFLYSNDNLPNYKLNQYEVSEILTNANIREVNEILNYYADCFQFENMSYIMALRYYLSNLILEDDPEKIDLLLNAFAKKYFNCLKKQTSSSLINNKRIEEQSINHENKDNNDNIQLPSTPSWPFKPLKSLSSLSQGYNDFEEKFDTVESIHMLSFATVMLDINLSHGDTRNNNNNENIEKMKHEFYMNLLGINDGENLSKKFIFSIFDSVYKFKLLKLYNHDILSNKSMENFTLQKVKLSIKLTKKSKRQKNLIKEYMLYMIGPIGLIVRLYDMKSIPKLLVNILENKLKLNKYCLKILPNEKKFKEIILARFKNTGIISLDFRSEYPLYLKNIHDFIKIKDYIKAIKYKEQFKIY